MLYCLSRLSDVDLEFDGELLAHESGYEPGKLNWHVVNIYKTASHKWVVERVGETARPDHERRPIVTVCETPEQVRVALLSRNPKQPGREYMINLCLDALTTAVDKDPELEPAMIVRV